MLLATSEDMTYSVTRDNVVRERRGAKDTLGAKRGVITLPTC